MAKNDHLVGYGKPPVEHRFKPGKSGNPRGRPKGARGFKSDVTAALGATVTIKENGRPRKITVVAAALKRLIQKAVSDGNLRAIEKLLALAQQTEATAQELPTLEPDDQAVLDAYLNRRAREPAHD